MLFESIETKAALQKNFHPVARNLKAAEKSFLLKSREMASQTWP